jgi:precorrin-2 dehydrogenase/sirohydrochlorin ferrochelatase
MKYYPINLIIKNRTCLVAGGGQVALRKVKRLVACEAIIRIISPQIESQLVEIAENNMIEMLYREIQSDDLDDAFLIFAATNEAKVNKSISQWAREKNILCNIADQPDESDFTLPSIIEQGDLNITISTNGKSPALSKYIRQRLQMEFGQEYATLLDMMGKLRKILTAEISCQNDRQKIFQSLLDSQILNSLKCNDLNTVSNTCKALTGHCLEDILSIQNCS